MWPLLLWVAAGMLGTLFVGWLVAERGRLLRRSTWQVIRACGYWPFFTLKGVHGYLYGRWPEQYIGLFVSHLFYRMGSRSKRWLADHYHGKVLVLEQAKTLISVDREIPLRDLEQIIPYPTARNLLLRGPLEVAICECPCRLARSNPCHPTQVCMIIGQPFVDFLMEHRPKVSRRITQAEALQLLEEEHRRGHVHAAWFKDVCLDRFFAICNCCKCCCGGIQAMVRHGIPMMSSSGYVAEVDRNLCRGCGRCRQVCPFGAILVNGKAEVDRSVCLGCGVCAGQCAVGAMSLTRDTEKGIPLDVRLMV